MTLEFITPNFAFFWPFSTMVFGVELLNISKIILVCKTYYGGSWDFLLKKVLKVTSKTPLFESLVEVLPIMGMVPKNGENFYNACAIL